MMLGLSPEGQTFAFKGRSHKQQTSETMIVRGSIVKECNAGKCSYSSFIQAQGPTTLKSTPHYTTQRFQTWSTISTKNASQNQLRFFTTPKKDTKRMSNRE